MTGEPTVFVVDDNQSVRRSMGELMLSAGLVVRTFASGQEFLDACDAEQPGCLVLDVRLRHETGLDLQDELKRRGFTLPVIVITGYANVPTSVRALKAGAFDFLTKPVRPQTLIARVREAMELDRQRRAAAATRSALRQRLKRLTPRERQIMQAIVDGKTSKHIAYELGLSVRTVEGHRRAIFGKMGVDSAAQLVSVVLGARGLEGG
jgi:FixJ family two-component response regulator